MPTKRSSLNPQDRAAAQLAGFKEAAQRLECDDDEQRFDEKMRKLAKAPHKPIAPKPTGNR